jgi:fimbrial chaperone protein
MISPSIFFPIIGLCSYLLVTGNVLAAGFSVKPTRIFINGLPQIEMTVGNGGDTEVFIQTELMVWSQQAEKDVYTTSREVLVSPPIFKIPAGGEQTVRVRYLKEPAKKERTYRLFLQEVQQSESDQKTPVTLKIGVPIFIQPEKVDPAQFGWLAKPTADGVSVQVNNTTNTHIQFTELKLSTMDGNVLSDEKVFVYVLPGQTYHWDIKLKQPLRVDKLVMQASSDRAEIKSIIDVNSSVPFQ